MNKNFYAVIMGFNKFADQTNLPDLEFAEKDAQDLYDALVDPACGNYPKENILLITGNASREEVETALYVHAVKERGPNDTVLIYYSGHGFIAGDMQEPYLAMPDTNVFKILKNPNAGLQMEYLRKNIFLAKSDKEDKKPKNLILFLDCCYSGSFFPDLKGGSDKRPRELIEAQDFNSVGRVAFVSSPAEVVSRESKDLQNGVFTSYLVRGLRREAIEKHNGPVNKENRYDVTMHSLISYVEAMCPKNQPPMSYGKSTRIVLAQPIVPPDPVPNTDKTGEETDYQLPDSFSPQNLISTPLYNPIEKQIEYIDKIVQCLKEVKVDSINLLGNRILNAIKDSLGANFAFVLRVDEQRNIKSKFLSSISTTNRDTQELAQAIGDRIYSFLVQPKSKILPKRFGFCIQNRENKGISDNLVIIPLRLEYPREFLVICGTNDYALQYGEILGHSLLSLYFATQEFISLDLTKIENFLIDDVKRSFGHVPYQTYLNRFDNLKKHLHRIEFAYEPIVHLQKRAIEIDSWEALARDPETKRAPYELFQAAELWGPEFTTELDLYCLEKAVKTYIELWKTERKNEPKLDSLAVNVYPETLFRKTYINLIKRLTEAKDFGADKLRLEISEKRPLVWLDRFEDQFVQDPTETFVNRIHTLSKELGITFSLDDFGVGLSSADRLAKLELDHVKIDREILHHPHPHYTIKYVSDIVQSSHKHPIKVVIEGFDGASRISLSEMFNDLKIKYIQGHMIRRASSTLADLDPEFKQYIVDKLTITNGYQELSENGDEQAYEQVKETHPDATENKSDIETPAQESQSSDAPVPTA